MSAFTVVSVLGTTNLNGRMKETIITATGTASYDTGGSVIDLSTSGVLDKVTGFQSVHGVECINVSLAASDKWKFSYVRVAAATGLLKVRDAAAGTAMAEVSAAADLSGTTFTFKVTGY